MKLHRVVLGGCTPTPLASYLKALGVLRILAEQKDPEVRGMWECERFVLFTHLDEEELVSFFLREWSPSPYVSPWNKGSGLAGRDPKGVDPLVGSVAPRFEQARNGIRQARSSIDEFARAVAEERAIKDEANRVKDKAGKERLRGDPVYKQRLARASRKCKLLKDEMQTACQRSWRGPALRWLRAAVVIKADGSAMFPALLGTGGNDGKLDFTNNAMQRLGDLFILESESGDPRPGAEEALRASLLGSVRRAMAKGGIGQFSPAHAGGANASAGALAYSLLNPWDLPLLLEGALLFIAGVSRRLGGVASERTVAPFSTRSWSAGYASAALADESKDNGKKPGGGEQWMPLWSRPWTAGEVSALLVEGRCQVGARPSDNALDVARAISRLGVARGVDAFERYAYIERNGKSNYAVPLGRWMVRASSNACLLDDLDRGGWWASIRRAARHSRAPASLARHERRLADAVLDALAHGEEPERWQRILVALAELEAQLVNSGGFTVKSRLQPIPRLSAGWVTAADDGLPEIRLALALGCAGAPHHNGQRWSPVRAHWLPLGRGGRFARGEHGLARDPRVVMTGRSAEDDLVRLVGRRVLEAESGASRSLPIEARPQLCARHGDLMALLRGRVDLDRAVWLARALAAVDRPGALPPARSTGDALDPAWAALRLCHLPAGALGDLHVPVDPAISRLLATSEPGRAFSLALLRLRAAGIRGPLRVATLDPTLARRYAASLAFPISKSFASHLAGALDPSFARSAQEHRNVG